MPSGQMARPEWGGLRTPRAVRQTPGGEVQYAPEPSRIDQDKVALGRQLHRLRRVGGNTHDRSRRCRRLKPLLLEAAETQCASVLVDNRLHFALEKILIIDAPQEAACERIETACSDVDYQLGSA